MDIVSIAASTPSIIAMGSQPTKACKSEVPVRVLPDQVEEQHTIPMLLRLSRTSPDWMECLKGNEMVILRNKMRTIVGRNGVTHLEFTCGTEPVRYLVGRYDYTTTVGEMLERSKPWIDQGRHMCAQHRADTNAKACASRSKIIVISSSLPTLNQEAGTTWQDVSAQERNQYLDIGFHQSLCRNRGATVLLASASTGQCIEEKPKPKSRTEGIRTQKLMRSTSGAAASSTAPALLFRNYFLTADPDDMLRERRYTAETDLTYQMNLLDGESLRPLLEPKGGLLIYTPCMSADQRSEYLRCHPDLYKQMKMARHDFVQVLYGVRYPAVYWGRLYLTGLPPMDVVKHSSQFVNQVFFVNEFNFLDRDEQFMLQVYKAHLLGSIIAAKENYEYLRGLSDCHGARRLIVPIEQDASVHEARLMLRALRSPEVFPIFVASDLELFVLCTPTHWRAVSAELESFVGGEEGHKIAVENLTMEDATFKARMKDLFSENGCSGAPDSQRCFDPSSYHPTSRTQVSCSEMCCWEESRQSASAENIYLNFNET